MRTTTLLLLLVALSPSAHAQDAHLTRADTSPHPWTDQPIRDAPGDFRFVIVSDRTGGMQPGVFERAMPKVDLLRPAFVLSVGDLIDGYTTDPDVWTDQWDAFDRIVDGLHAPFFYVPGNHDVSNAEMEAAWQARYGPTYYHFVYKDVLFVVLNSDEQWPDGGISDTQIDATRAALADNADVRWTFVVLHRPLFAYGNQAGFERIDSLLTGRPRTVFAGHHHHYLNDDRDGMDYVILGTTGGGSHLRGAEFGELHHVTQVSMTDDGPTIAHIEIDAIHDVDLVDQAAYRLVQPLREGRWLTADPILHDTPTARRLSTTLTITNTADRPMHASGDLSPSGLVRFEPSTVDTTVAPNASLRLPLALVADDVQRVEAIAEAGVRVDLMGAYTRDDGVVLSLPAARDLALDWRHVLAERDSPAQIDGELAEWDTAAMLRAYRPGFLQEDWDWQGPDDGWFRFAAASDDGDLMLAVEAFDERLLTADRIAELQDKVIVEIERAPGTSPLRIEVAPGPTPTTPLLSVSDPTIRVRAASRQTDGGLIVELALPLPASPFRLNVGWMDHDRPENTKPSVLWWRPRATDSAPGGGPFTYR